MATGLTVAEIACGLGDVDLAYFTRFFARDAGGTAGEFRHRDPPDTIAGHNCRTQLPDTIGGHTA